MQWNVGLYISLLNLSLHGDTIHPIIMCISAEHELMKFSSFISLYDKHVSEPYILF